MPTVVTRYVNTASSGGDGTTNNTSGATAAYATLEAARADLVTDYASLVASDVQVDLICSGSADDTTALGATWPTSDTTRYIHIQVPAADRKVEWDNAIYVYSRTVNFAAAFTVQTNTLRLTGIQIAHLGALDVAGNHGIYVSSLGGELWLDGVKVSKYANNGQVAIYANGVAGTYVFRNVMTFGSTFRFREGIYLDALPDNTAAYIYNATVHGPGSNSAISVLFTVGGSSKIARVKNCLMQNFTNGLTITNATTSETATNYHATTTDAGFVASATGDFTLLSSDTKGRDLGTNLSAVSDYPFNIDANEDPRNSNGTWDIGAHEYQVPEVRATQIVLEALLATTPALRLTQQVVEVLISQSSATATVRLTQAIAEVLTLPTPGLRATQLVAEALVAATPALRATQVSLEALIAPTPALRATQIVLEALVQVSPLSIPLTGQLFPRGSVPPY